RTPRRLCVLSSVVAPRALHAFPTRRSSDLGRRIGRRAGGCGHAGGRGRPGGPTEPGSPGGPSAAAGSAGCFLAGGAWTASAQDGDRKSTRLNSSHVSISYAVFCLKKKTQTR